MKSSRSPHARIRRGIAVASLVALASGLAACGGSADETVAVGATFDEVVELAGKEKSLNIYSAFGDGANADLVKAFNKQYPDIKVQVTRLISSDLTSRFASETQSGASSADLLLMTDSVMFEQDADWFLDLDEKAAPNLAKVPEDYAGGHWFTAIVSPYVLTYNKNLVKEPPTTWEALADSQYAGKQTLADPHSSDSVNAFWLALKETYGDDFLEKLGKQNKSWYASAAPSVQTVAAGQFEFSAPTGQFHSLTLRRSGAPIDYVMPTPAVGFAGNAAVAKNAENPNAATLFADFLLTPEGQNAYCGDDQEGMTVIEVAADKCGTAPEDFTVVDPAAAGESRDDILAAFNLAGK